MRGGSFLTFAYLSASWEAPGIKVEPKVSPKMVSKILTNAFCFWCFSVASLFLKAFEEKLSQVHEGCNKRLKGLDKYRSKLETLLADAAEVVKKKNTAEMGELEACEDQTIRSIKKVWQDGRKADEAFVGKQEKKLKRKLQKAEVQILDSKRNIHWYPLVFISIHKCS